MIINGNVVRALQRLERDPSQYPLLVDDEYIETVKKLLITEDTNDMSIQKEFHVSYKLVKDYINRLTAIDSKEDLDVIKEAQKFLLFILRNEEKLNDIEAVKAFKEAVLGVLDEESNELRDRVITKLGEL